jgi:hypothetical protein
METHAVLIQRNIEYRNYQQGRKGDARSPLVMELAELARMEFGYSAATNDLDIVRSIITYFKQRKVA